MIYFNTIITWIRLSMIYEPCDPTDEPHVKVQDKKACWLNYKMIVDYNNYEVWEF